MSLTNALKHWYIPLKSGSVLHLLRSRVLRLRGLHCTSSGCKSEGPSFVDNKDDDSTITSSGSSLGENRSRAKAEKQRRRKERLDAIRRVEDDGEIESDQTRRRREAASRKSGRTKDVITYDLPTKQGEKKDVTAPLPAAYSPTYVEACWYDWWEQMGFFTPEYQTRENQTRGVNKTPFVVCLPPPNVTGVLHLGHTLTATIQDSLVRWHRMRGDPTLWVPGCDHAGIATQVVVERHLQHEKRATRQDLGREQFVKHVWKWKEEKGGEIYQQLRRLGASLDWTRESFTMDERFSAAVREAFVRLHDAEIIYRSSQLVNWSCALKSAISDIEVDQMTLTGRTGVNVPGYSAPIDFGMLIYFSYPVEGSDSQIPVATTRIETMLGDTGIAVHPDDERYRHLVGQFAIHPFTGRKLPIIADDHVDRDYGTGAVKITPAHDYNDYEMGKRHGLDSLSVIDESGVITDAGQEFKGMMRFDARSAVLQALKDKGLYQEVRDNPMSIPICSRSGDVVEPLLKSQWFVKCAEMGQNALRAVETGDLAIVPDMYIKTWQSWLSNVRDWCISRQLWWGHRIPAYRVTLDGIDSTGKETTLWVSGQTKDEAMQKAASKFGVESHQLSLTQDEDVLDTWFSSSLFPFAVHGWPEQTEDLDQFYPCTILETGYDILFFWVARMVMMGQQLTGKLPFSKVYLHSMVRDAHGRKMSKSLGNVIDPLDVVQGISLEELQARLTHGNLKLDPKEMAVAIKGQRSDFPHGIPECGTDALRFALASYNSLGQDINLNVARVMEFRHFCNKIWNATKFALSAFHKEEFRFLSFAEIEDMAGPMDRWILSKFSETVLACHEGFSSVDLPVVTSALYRFWLHNLCDIYLECIKDPLKKPSSSDYLPTINVLHAVIEGALRLLHPLMPYLTEELFQRLPQRLEDDCPSICIAPYPQVDEFTYQDEETENGVSAMLDVVHTVRSLESMLGMKRGQSKVGILCKDEGVSTTLGMLKEPLATLVKSPAVTITHGEHPPSGSAALAVGNRCTVYLPLHDTADKNTRERLQARCRKAQIHLAKLQATMAVPNYNCKVPETVKQSHQTKVEELEAEISSLEELLSSLSQASSS
ncbi:valine--tRNA ligase-like [Diadema setosum]|uniref:valine--tRNA ligase-like n=1 Tax=Diadema setosum TaxID=31175 RepID=UPI003B3AB6DC